MDILVTGGAGFIGSSICLQLKEKYPHYKITAFDNLRRRGSELNLPALQDREVNFIHGDIRNPEDLEAAPAFDLMVEASAEPSVMAGLGNNPSYVINNNLNGSINCFNACLRHQARLVFLSTSRVYPISRIENAAFIEEDTRFAFAAEQQEAGISKTGISESLSLDGARSFYGATKLASELFIQEYAAFFNMKHAITRFGVVAGPGQMGKTDQGVVTLWAARHFWKQPLSYIGYGGRGKQVRDILHIDDLVRLIDRQVHQPDIFHGKVYNAGGGLAFSASLAEMTALCEEITGNKVPIYPESKTRPADLRIYLTDNSRITADTGWRPEKSVNEVMADIFDWISSNELKLKKILNG
ncbi:MAG: hypothetical protein RI973_2444 [Bacteroidota bacterium]|jgi:CDP-paratose 2-epimerase